MGRIIHFGRRLLASVVPSYADRWCRLGRLDCLARICRRNPV